MDSMDSKEYIWCAKLTSKSKAKTYEGQDDGSLEQLVLKRACLGAEAKENDRNLVEVTSFDHNQEKIQVIICSLRVGLKEDTELSDITVFPPAIFKLVEGEGPVHLVANHMMLEEEDVSDDDIDSDDMLSTQTRRPSGKKSAPQPTKKAQEYMDDEADDDDDDDDDMEDDDDISDEDFDDDEEEEEIPPPKKHKSNDENRKPVVTSQKGKIEKKAPSTPKTPLQQKQNKTPQSGKKPPTSMKTPNQKLANLDSISNDTGPIF